MERNLKQFIAVAETGSITAAAARLNVSQPTITVNIRNLEDKHGVELFERTPRGMVLTEYGSILYDSAIVIQRAESQAAESINRQRQKRRQAIRVGCGHAWWRLFVHEAIRELIDRDVPAAIHVEAGNNLQCMWKMLAGDIGVSVGHKIEDLDPAINVTFQPLFQSVDGHFVARDHPLAQRRCTLEELREYTPIVSVPHDFHYEKVLVKEAVEPAIATPYSTNSLVTCVDMVIWTRGYTAFPMDMAGMLASLGLVPVPQIEPEPAKDVGLYYLTENAKSADLMALVDRMTEAAHRYAAARPAAR